VRTAAAPGKTTIEFCIAPDHPAIPGHFPGAPVVPGALLLAEGLHRLELLAGAPIQCQRIESAKFFRSVAAGATVTATLTAADRGQANVEFSVDGTMVAQLTLTAARPAAADAHE